MSAAVTIVAMSAAMSGDGCLRNVAIRNTHNRAR